MNAPRIALAAALGVAVCGALALAPPTLAAPQAADTSQAHPLSRAEIEAAITKAGYKDIRRIKVDDGVWEAKVRDANDRRVKLSVDPITGKVYPDDVHPKVTAQEVHDKLTAAGYQRVHDIEFDDGLWTADARNSQGQKVDIKVDPEDGHIINVRRDY